jgi:hypothetical protein
MKHSHLQKLSIMNALFVPLCASILISWVPTSAMALIQATSSDSGVVCSPENCTIGDYNLGMTGGGSMIEISHQPTELSGLLGIIANGELTHLGSKTVLEATDFTFFDNRLITMITPGVRKVGEDQLQATFSLRVVGSLAGGLMVYRVIPVNFALEDGQFRADSNGTSGNALLGTSIVLPISLIANLNQYGIDGMNLYVSVTAGMRIHSESNENLMGIQPKVRFVSDHFSVEAKYLYGFAPNTIEQKGSLIAAVNHLFKRGDQLGLLASYDQLTSLESTQKFSEVLLFYGGNL